MTSRPWLASAVLPARGGGEGAGAPLSENGWRATVVGLHAVFCVVLALSVLAVLTGAATGSRPVLLGVLGLLGIAYAVGGAPALGAEGHPVRAIGYLLTLVVVSGVIGWQAPELLFLLFVGYPQVWFMVEGARPGIVWTVALATASALGDAQDALSGEGEWSDLLSTLVGLLFSVALGVWISQVLQQSRERASLIAQLESTRAELATAHREQGVMAERERLAREVHDTLAQGYTSIVVLAQTAVAQLAHPDRARERLALIEEVARENLAEARAMVAAFAPVALDGSTLAEALQRLAERFGRETGLPTRVDTAALADGVTLRRDEEIVLLRGAQEALTNVRRHAGASAVVVRLTRDAGQVSVHVEDDGVGFDPTATEGSGLAGLRDRVAVVGGEIGVVSAPGEGTRVTVSVAAP